MSELGDELETVLRPKWTQRGGWASSPGVASVMRANTRRDTNPELRVRRVLHASGLRFRVDLAPLASQR